MRDSTLPFNFSDLTDLTDLTELYIDRTIVHTSR